MTDAIVRQDEDRRFLFGGIGETNWTVVDWIYSKRSYLRYKPTSVLFLFPILVNEKKRHEWNQLVDSAVKYPVGEEEEEKQQRAWNDIAEIIIMNRAIKFDTLNFLFISLTFLKMIIITLGMSK
jgi:hypothetical protein